MAAHSGSNKVTDGLVLSIDADNVKNYKNITSNNIVVGGAFPNGNDIPAEGGSNTQNDIIQLPNPGDSAYVLRQTMGTTTTEYQLTYSGVIQPSTTYVLSGWYAESTDYVGDSRMFHCRAYSASGAHTSLGYGVGAQIGDSVTVGGLTWSYKYATITSPADASGVFMWYVGFGTSSYTGARYYTNLKIEQGTYPTVPDLTLNQNDFTAVNGVGHSNGAYNFDGTNDRLSLPSIDISGDFTVESWINLSSGSGYTHVFSSFPSQHTFACKIAKSGENLVPYFYSGSLSLNTYQASSSGLTIGQWHHVVYLYGQGKYQVYLDGDLYREVTTSNSPNMSNQEMTINGSLNEFNSFSLGGLNVYDRSLTASEVKQNFMANRKRFGI